MRGLGVLHATMKDPEQEHTLVDNGNCSTMNFGEEFRVLSEARTNQNWR